MNGMTVDTSITTNTYACDARGASSTGDHAGRVIQFISIQFNLSQVNRNDH